MPSFTSPLAHTLCSSPLLSSTLFSVPHSVPRSRPFSLALFQYCRIAVESNQIQQSTLCFHYIHRFSSIITYLFNEFNNMFNAIFCVIFQKNSSQNCSHTDLEHELLKSGCVGLCQGTRIHNGNTGIAHIETSQIQFYSLFYVQYKKRISEGVVEHSFCSFFFSVVSGIDSVLLVL